VLPHQSSNPTSPTSSLQYALDRIAIQDVIALYSLGQDSHQGKDANVLEQWDQTFTDDATVDYSVAGGTVGSYRELARWMRGESEQTGSMSAFSNWQHMLSLPNVKLEGDTATARTDFFATHRSLPTASSPIHFNAAGAFVDELVRTPAGWRISSRKLELYFADPLAVVSAWQG
jgi:hypothetical protein